MTSSSEMALYSGAGYDITGHGKPETNSRRSRYVHIFFSVLGVQPIYGRVFLPEEDQPGRNQEIILSLQTLAGRFAPIPTSSAGPSTLTAPYTIIGVMGPKMTKPDFAAALDSSGALTSKEAPSAANITFMVDRAPQARHHSPAGAGGDEHHLATVSSSLSR